MSGAVLITSPCPRGGRRAPKERDGRGATLDTATARVVLLSGDGVGVSALRSNESTLVNCLALHLTRRHRFAAFADLASGRERLGNERSGLNNLPLSEGRSARAEGARRGGCNARYGNCASCAAVGRRRWGLRIAIKRVETGELSGVAPHPATPLRGFRRPLLGQGEVRK